MEKIRIMPFGGCTINNPLLTLQREGYTSPIFRELGFKRSAYSLSPGGAIQLLKFCRGELQIPRLVRCGIYADPDHVPADKQTEIISKIDLALVEYSTPFEITYDGFVLNQNRLKELVSERLDSEDKVVKKQLSRWMGGLQKDQEEMRAENAAHLLAVLPDESDDDKAVRELVNNAGSHMIGPVEMRQSLEFLQTELNAPIGVVAHNFQYMPDGRPVVWPPEFNEQVTAEAAALGMKVFDPAALVAEHGVEAAVAADFRHWNEDFYPKVAAAFHDFVKVILAESETNITNFESDSKA